MRNTAAATLPSLYGQFELKLNHAWHSAGLKWYTAIVLAHWAEHLVQAFQIFVLGWPRPQSLGLIGQFFPWMFKTEIMHYGYALVMMIGFWIFRAGFKGRASTWWMIAFWIQVWHHFEHLLLQGQVLFSHNLFGSPVPVSILQLWAPRVELHLFYNTIVFIPMVAAMWFHLFPNDQERAQARCSCAWH